MNPKKIVFLLLLTVVFVAGCMQQQTPTGQVLQQGTEQEVLATIKVVAGDQILVDKQISVEKGLSGLEAMREATDIEVQEFDFGVMVTSIASVQAGTANYWALYINGNYADKGIDQYTLNEDTSIEWRLEKIEAFPLE